MLLRVNSRIFICCVIVLDHCLYVIDAGCVAQWLERRSLTGELSLASARSVVDV